VVTEVAHDRVYAEIADKHRISGTLVSEPDAIFEIFEVGADGLDRRCS
jgi:hypothetical protein